MTDNEHLSLTLKALLIYKILLIFRETLKSAVRERNPFSSIPALKKNQTDYFRTHGRVFNELNETGYNNK